MQRVLDIDLDFFVYPPIHWASDEGPRPSNDHWVMPHSEALAFLRERCQLSERLPGWTIEHHDEAFTCWRQAIGAGTLVPPFHVTHLDAHSDLGFGLDLAFRHIFVEVTHLPPEDRSLPQVVSGGLNFGNWLAYALACRWVSSLDYVYGPGGGSDVLNLYRSSDGDGLQMKTMSAERLREAVYDPGLFTISGGNEPVVPFREIGRDEFTASETYDAIVLCRSPGYTPASADSLYDLICADFIEDWPK